MAETWAEGLKTFSCRHPDLNLRNAAALEGVMSAFLQDRTARLLKLFDARKKAKTDEVDRESMQGFFFAMMTGTIAGLELRHEQRQPAAAGEVSGAAFEAGVEQEEIKEAWAKS